MKIKSIISEAIKNLEILHKDGKLEEFIIFYKCKKTYITTVICKSPKSATKLFTKGVKGYEKSFREKMSPAEVSKRIK